MYAALLWGVWFVVASEVLPWYSECVAAFDLLNGYGVGDRMGMGTGMCYSPALIGGYMLGRYCYAPANRVDGFGLSILTDDC